ncbi:MAG TPA: DUF4920 domain-containing protein [Kofleriaceae bacterium]|nr:DUF4920 domain-containing protein [Kofleriaceae bacterium]
MSRTGLFAAACACACACLVAATAGCDKGPKTAARVPSASADPNAVGATASAAAAGGQTFGAGVKLPSATAISTILADPKAYAGKPVRVEGMVVDVCPMRGCWMDLAGSAPGEKLKFKVQDGEMTFPVDAKGKYAVAEGVVAVNDLSLEDSVAYAKYQAEEVGKPFDPASVTAPITVVRLDGTGAILRDRP